MSESELAQVVAEQCPEAGRHGEHGADSGHNLHRQLALMRRSGFDGLEHGRRHGEDTRVPARHHRHMPPVQGEIERKMGAVEFHPVVAAVPYLPGALGKAIEIGPIADEIGGAVQDGLGFRRDPEARPRPQPDHGQRARHGRRPCPGTRTTAK